MRREAGDGRRGEGVKRGIPQPIKCREFSTFFVTSSDNESFIKIQDTESLVVGRQ